MGGSVGFVPSSYVMVRLSYPDCLALLALLQALPIILSGSFNSQSALYFGLLSYAHILLMNLIKLLKKGLTCVLPNTCLEELLIE